MNPIRKSLQRLAVAAALVSLLVTTSGCGVDLPTAPTAGATVTSQRTATMSALEAGGGDLMQEAEGGTGTTAVWEGAAPVPARDITASPTPRKSHKPKKHPA
jgi:hypothetical protein